MAERYEPRADELHEIRSAASGVLRRLIGAHDPDYEDLVQSAIAHALATFESNRFRGECPPTGWAAVIARNVAIDAIRARVRERQLFAHEPASGPETAEVGRVELRDGPEHLTSVQERLDRVGRALATLPAPSAQVVLLHDLLGHDLAAVASRLRITVSAAQSRLVRGRREVVARSRLTPPPAPVRPRSRRTFSGGGTHS